MSFLSRIGRALQWRVDHWSISTSGWREDVPSHINGNKNYEFARVFVHCESTIWYIRFLEWLAWDNGFVLCSWLHPVRLPRFIREWERHWDSDDPEYFAKFEDWFGDDLGCLWHLYVESPILQWVWGLKKNDQINEVELTCDEARKAFQYHPEKLEWVWKSMQESLDYDKEKQAEEAAKDTQDEASD